jgi:hypothetical protein
MIQTKIDEAGVSARVGDKGVWYIIYPKGDAVSVSHEYDDGDFNCTFFITTGDSRIQVDTIIVRGSITVLAR